MPEGRGQPCAFRSHLAGLMFDAPSAQAGSGWPRVKVRVFCLPDASNYPQEWLKQLEPSPRPRLDFLTSKCQKAGCDSTGQKKTYWQMPWLKVPKLKGDAQQRTERDCFPFCLLGLSERQKAQPSHLPRAVKPEADRRAARSSDVP